MAANRTDIFESYPVPQALKAMILPTIFAQIIVLIYNIADTFYLGRIGNPLMVAGVSLILPVFNLFLVISALAGTGGGTLISRLLGKKQLEEAKRVSAFSIWMAIVLAAAFALVMLLKMTPILTLLGASPEALPFARQYTFCVIVLGGIPTVLSNVLSHQLRSIGSSKQASFGITMGGLINIALDPLFMFVLLPKGSEVLGVGIATLLSNCIACTYFIVVVIRSRKDSVITFRFKNGLPTGESIGSIFNVGIPAAIATLLFDLDYILLDKLMASYGDIALASIGIVLKAERLPLNVGIGICQGMIPLVAYNYSALNQERTRKIIRYALCIGLIVSAFSIAMYELAAGCIMRFFINDPETIALGTNIIRIRILATPLMFSSFFTVFLFQGLGRGKTSLMLGCVRWLIICIPMMYLLNHFFGMYGILWSQAIGDIFTVTFSYLVYRHFARNHLSSPSINS